MTDIEIARGTKMLKISEVAKKLNIDEEYLEYYGKYKAKIDLGILDNLRDDYGKLILVTSVNPTPFGEGKTTMSIGIHDGMRKLGFNSLAVLREPSLGPVFGIKGGFSSALQKVKFKSISNSSGLIYAVLTDERIQKFLENGSRSGSILKHASTLKKYLFIPYNFEDYVKASDKIQPLFELAVKLKIVNIKLDDLKQGLLAWYLY